MVAREKRYSFSKHLAMIVGSGQWKSVNLAMFTAYFDASGKQDQPIIVVAGFVSSAELWIDWEKEWLDRLAVDNISCFHATELGRLGESRKAALIKDLCAITRSYASAKAAVAVANKQVDGIFSDDERKEWRIHAYALGGRTVAKSMRLWADQWRGPLPELVFERGDDGASCLRSIMTSQGYPEPIFKPKRPYTHPKSGITEQPAIPLQAADLLAHEVFIRVRHWAGLTPEERPEFLAGEFSRLPIDLENIPGECGTVEVGRLRLIRQALEEDDPEILVPSVKIRVNP